MASSYDSVKRQANKGSEAKNTVNDWIANGLNTALVQIQSNDNEDIIVTKNGLLGRSYDEITGTYSPEQIKLTHNIIAYTDDNWQTVRQAIGKHKYKYYDKDADAFVDRTGYGITSEFLTSGFVSGSQIVGGDIYSDNYSASGTGSYLNLRDGTFSFGGGALRFDGKKLIISSNVADTNITEVNEGWLKTTGVYAQNLQVKSTNIDGVLTIGQLPSTVAEIEDIPTKLSELTNDAGYQTESGVTSIVGGIVTTDYINALDISVNAANITGTLNASDINITGAFIAQKNDGTNGGKVGYMSGYGNIETNGIGMSNSEGNIYVIVTDEGVRLQAGENSIYMTIYGGSLVVRGNLEVFGNISYTGELTKRTEQELSL